MRKCLKCQNKKPLNEYYHSKGFPQSYCKICQCAFAKEWRKINAIKVKESKRMYLKNLSKDDRRRIKYLQRYKIALDDYSRMLSEQNGVCAICKQCCVNKEVLSVDHCHMTGMVRGLLCDKCNNMIGRANDNPEILRKGAEYLDNIWAGK